MARPRGGKKHVLDSNHGGEEGERVKVVVVGEEGNKGKRKLVE